MDVQYYFACLLLMFIHRLRAASFFGDSYLNLPFVNSRDVELKLRFLTWQSHGLLFLARGSTDYLYLYLQDGHVQIEGDFGSGSLTWKSQQTKNDGNWHHLLIKQNTQYLTVTLDASESQISIPGKFHELNENEVFVGGMQKTTSFSKKWSYFRGCLGDVEFSKYDIISNAQKLPSSGAVHHLSWDCTMEIKAQSSSPIHFHSNASFAAFHHLPFTTTGTISVQFKTWTENSLLLFNLARKNNKDLLAIEIISKKLKLTLNKGGDNVVINSDLIISDGMWHLLSIQCKDKEVKFLVDKSEQSAMFDDKSRSNFEFSGHFFLGGLTSHVLAHAVDQNIESLSKPPNQGHYIGCVKNLSINSKLYGFQQMQLSHDLDTNCGNVSECIQNCQTTTTQSTFRSHNSTPAYEDQYVEVRGVTLKEGTEKVITTDNIFVLVDYKELKIRESAIQFDLMRFPKHGHLLIDLGRRRRNRDVFTLLDLQGRKVSYVHDGSETTRDEVTLNMKIATDTYDIAEMQKSYTFLLPFYIEPVDDKPKLNLLNSTQNEVSLNMAKDTKLRITKSIIEVIDPDSSPANSQISVVCTPRIAGKSPGHFMESDTPTQERSKFAYQEILDGKIWFSSGPDSSSCLLTIGGYSKRLDINAVDVSLHLENTGIRVTQGSHVVISNMNVLVTNNVPIQGLEIRYRITTPPEFGDIQRRMYSNDSWQSVDTFAQRHIDNNQIRYINRDKQYLVQYDRFSVEISVLNTTIKGLLYILVDRLKIEIVGINKVTIQQNQFKIISKEELQAKTNDQWYKAQNIKFDILRRPHRGNLYRIHHSNISEELITEMTPLSNSDIFSQEDINSGYIVYRLHRMTYEKVTDFIDFRVTAPPAIPKLMRLNVEFIPRQTQVRLTNNLLDTVLEGKEEVITKDFLYLETDDYQNFEFDVVDFPKHGTLKLKNGYKGFVRLRKNEIARFSNADIKNDRLVYEHDDTENDRDSFAFVASPILTSATTFPAKVQEFSGRFHIRVIMKNDNPPRREVDKPFRVVSNKERLITVDDLSFSDPDMNYNTMDLRYEREKIPNGEIVNSEDGKAVLTFTQGDIVKGKIKFRHHGEENAKVLMKVYDGNYIEHFLFSIQAGSPYIAVQNNTGAYVQVGEDVNISTYNLSIETNVNVKPEEVSFVMIEEPLHGNLKINGQTLTQFTLKNLMDGSVKYRHTHGGMGQDYFKFAVVAGEARTQGQFRIHILQGTPSQIPRVINNNVLQVQSLKSSVISRSHLEVFSSLSQPSSIVFTVQSRPRYGAIYVTYRFGSRQQSSFTQWDINSGAVSYRHTQKGHRTDFFTFDVADGVTGQRLRGLTFGIEVLPPPLDIETRNLSIREGGKKPLSPADIVLKFTSPTNQTVVFHVVRQPRHGHLELIEKRNEALSTFTMDDLRQGRVYYVHDGSDSKFDEMVIKGQMGGKEETDDHHLYIHIDAVNDEAPQVITNKGLTLWQSSMALISKDILYAEDPDTPEEGVWYSVTKPTNGRVAFLNNTFKDITRFTQQSVNDGQVVFVHEGGNSGSFWYHLSDGQNSNANRMQFLITTRKLVLTVVNNKPLQVHPEQIQRITTDHLLSRTNNPNQTKDITYHVPVKPEKGRLITRINNRVVPVVSFTQKDINDGQIYYQHESVMLSIEDTDKFVFEVNTVYAETVKNQVFNIAISYSSQSNRGKIRLRKLTLAEGDQKILSKSNLDISTYVRQLEASGRVVSAMYSLVNVPKHGTLTWRGGNALRELSNFTQEYINLNRIVYHHDDSESRNDSFSFLVYLDMKYGSSEEIQILEETFPIEINPVNDEPFYFVPDNPVLEVTEGGSTVVDARVLKMVDKDSPPERLWYEVQTQPNNGILSFQADPQRLITAFTQKDVDDGDIIFTQKGPPLPSFLELKITDGKFPRKSVTVAVSVVSLTLEIVTNATINIPQASTSVYITRSQLDIRTNGEREKIEYTITRPPSHGQIYLKTYPVTTFTQLDIDNDHEVMYVQNDLNFPNDRFFCDISYQGSEFILRNKLISVSVKPFVKQKPIQLSKENQTAITLQSLDARGLANVTGSIPHYKIIHQPKYGIIVSVVRRKRDVQSGYMPVEEFTHRDIENRKIFYIFNRPVRGQSEDRMTYLLTAKGVQPALGQLVFNLPHSSGINGSNVDGVGTREVVSPSVRNDFVLILAILIPLCVIVILGVIIVYLLWRKRRYPNYTPPSDMHKNRLRPEISGPIPLNQPHVHIEPNENASDDEHSLVYEHHNYYNVPVVRRNVSEDSISDSHEYSNVGATSQNQTEVSATVPECKVTPLGDLNLRDSIVSRSSVDLFDWSVMDDPELLQYCRTSAPVLKDSQYWV
ncbi:chondroitin sulfate proteoglycan 4-like [Saccostrea cucullata]|uniref:chondroitin sulfate proteoglycan 4-like n=1 Tax=Saccostrea cuccullata TaxID=36930 RepID=UPI002ECFE1A5